MFRPRKGKTKGGSGLDLGALKPVPSIPKYVDEEPPPPGLDLPQPTRAQSEGGGSGIMGVPTPVPARGHHNPFGGPPPYGMPPRAMPPASYGAPPKRYGVPPPVMGYSAPPLMGYSTPPVTAKTDPQPVPAQSRQPPLFPSAMSTVSKGPSLQLPSLDLPVVEPKKKKKEKEEEKDERLIEEAVFPPGVMSDLQKQLEKNPETGFIGLEYLIEIQHNTSKKLPPAYCCLLCDSNIRTKEARTDTIELAKGHLKSTNHKQKYLKKFFEASTGPLFRYNFRKNTRIDQLTEGLPESLKNRILDVDSETGRVNFFLQYVTRRFGFQKVKLVVGQKLFKKKMQEIRTSIENSTHFKEDEECLEMWLPRHSRPRSEPKRPDTKPTKSRWDRDPSPERIKPASSRWEQEMELLNEERRRLEEEKAAPSKIDEYADAFAEFEKAEKEAEAKERRSGSFRGGDPRDRYDDRSRSRSRSRHRRSPSPFSKRQQQEFRGEGLSLPKPIAAAQTISDDDDDDIQITEEHIANPGGRRRKHHHHSRSKSRRRSESISSVSSSSSRDSYGGGKRKRRDDKSVSRSRSPAGSRMTAKDKGTVEYLKERVVLEGMLRDEKKRFLKKADEHPEYQEQWALFYSAKCREYGTRSIRAEYINDEWMITWKKFYEESHDKRCREENNKLLNKYRLLRKDLDEFAAKYPDLMDELEGVASPGKPKPRSSPSQDHTGSKREKKPQEKEEAPTEVPTVISTLRLLSALEHLLDDLGPRIISAMGKANLQEKASPGSSQDMIQQEDVFHLFRGAREKLTRKLDSTGAIGDNVREISRKVTDNITIILQQSKHFGSVAPSQEAAAPPPPPSSSSSMPSFSLPDPNEIAVKAAIANTVAEQFRAAGTTVSGAELTRIVDEQYHRVKGSLPGAIQKQQEAGSASSSAPRDKFSPNFSSSAARGSASRDRSIPAETESENQRDRRSYSPDESFTPLNQQSSARPWDGGRNNERDPVSSDRGHAAVPIAPLINIRDPSRSVSPPPSWERPSGSQGGSAKYFAEESARASQPIIAPVPRPPSGVNWNALENAVQQVNQSGSHHQQSSSSSSQYAPGGPRVISAACTSGPNSEQDGNNFDELTLEDLTSLFKNFRDLDKESQTNLIAYMKKLELTNPDKVKELKRHIHGGR